MSPLPIEISPQEVRQRLAGGEPVHLIDVREPPEFEICRIDGAELVPLRAIPGAVGTLKERAAHGPVVLYCHHGVRSLQAARWLRRQGLAACQSMQGGIDLWSAAIDAAVPRY